MMAWSWPSGIARPTQSPTTARAAVPWVLMRWVAGSALSAPFSVMIRGRERSTRETRPGDETRLGERREEGGLAVGPAEFGERWCGDVVSVRHEAKDSA